MGIITTGLKGLGKVATGPVGRAMTVADAVTPVKGGMSADEAKALKDGKSFAGLSAKEKSDIIKDKHNGKITSTQTKKQLLKGPKAPASNLTIGDVTKDTKITPRTDTQLKSDVIKDKLDGKITPNEAQKKLTKIKIKTADATKKIAENVSPKDLKKLEAVKKLLGKSSSYVKSKTLLALKHNKKIAALILAGTIGYGYLESYLTGEDIEVEEEDITNEIDSILDDGEPLTLGGSTMPINNGKPLELGGNTEQAVSAGPSGETTEEDLSEKTNYKDREISRTSGGGYIFTGKDGKTRTYNTLEEAQFDIDFNLNTYYQDEYAKALASGDNTKLAEVIKRAKEKDINLEQLEL